ncbi:hypothetical protein HF086_012778 [Spodoptera exigua]|uniref:PHD-type domain-containing protein n=1 Tax=Spodoptera exigua TaxID=7107 RepID=A0A922SIH2_SPOEX|nr:hypothetical protein HF086_012778 [Spodoptera exigua]
MICSACCKIINCDDEILRCSRENCGKLYHPICTAITNVVTIDIHTWICPECRCAIKKVGDNSFTPVGSKQDPNVTFRKKSLTVTSSTSNNNGDGNIAFTSEINSLRSEMATLKVLLINALSLISSHEEKLGKYAFQVEQLNNKLEKYEKDNIQIDLSRADPNSSSCIISDTFTSPRTNQLPIPMQHDVERGHKSSEISQQVKPHHVPPVNQTLNNSVLDIVSQEHNTQNDGEWIEVKKRNHRQRQKPLHGTVDPLAIKLKTMEIRKYFHLWNMASDVDEVRQYLSQLYPAANCSVEELSARGDYKSYKIGATTTFFDQIYSIHVWPINAKIKPWINHRKSSFTSKTNDLENSSSRRPFRN